MFRLGEMPLTGVSFRRETSTRPMLPISVTLDMILYLEICGRSEYACETMRRYLHANWKHPVGTPWMG
jgi:hypothetical protein